MNSILGQVSYPVFISGIFVFFIIASAFSFIVGVGLATRSPKMMRFCDYMNKRISTRRLMKPLVMPRYVEPILLKRPGILGGAIILGALGSIWLLKEVDDIVFQPMYSGVFSIEVADILSDYTHSFLLIGNGLCILVGILLLFFPHLLSAIERRTDKWYTLRKQTRALEMPLFHVDQWVLAHPTVSGVTLSVLSLGLGLSMYVRI